MPRSPPESGASATVRPVVAPPLNTTHRYESNVVDIYVLECEGGNYYVGMTENGERRLRQHIMGKGAKWTQKHKPKKIVEYHRNMRKSDEKKITERMMKKYGSRKVRGGPYVRTKMSQSELRALEKKVGFPGTTTTKKTKKKPSKGRQPYTKKTKTKKAKPKNPRCKAKTVYGHGPRCKLTASPGSDYCRVHAPYYPKKRRR